MKKKNIIDMWYGDIFKPRTYAVNCFFYPHGCFGYSYRGNIYDKNGDAIGDWASDDTTWIGKTFGIEWR